jgi:hypothetical protein
VVKYARTRAQMAALLVGGALLGGTGCNQIAGISDYTERSRGDAGDDTDAGATDGGGPSDGGVPLADGAVPASTDAGSGLADGGADAGALDDAGSAPGCVTLTLQVTEARTAVYTGVAQRDTFVLAAAVGETQNVCVPVNSPVDLRAQPDNNGALHSWTVTPQSDRPMCADTGRRCQFTLTTDTVVKVTLD